jgi:hypothetical protein
MSNPTTKRASPKNNQHKSHCNGKKFWKGLTQDYHLEQGDDDHNRRKVAARPQESHAQRSAGLPQHGHRHVDTARL